MKRMLVGGLALGFTAVGTLALGGPVGAQTEDDFVERQGSLSASSAAPGEELIASSVDSCTVPEGETRELYWSVWAVDGAEPVVEEFQTLEADGTWSVTFEAPSDPGDYDFYAVCEPDLPAEEPAEEEEEMLDDLAASQAPMVLDGEEPEAV